jgi:HK97 family phage major capsid protein
MSAKQRRRPVTKTIGGSLMEERIYDELTDRVKAVAENVEKVAVIREDVEKIKAELAETREAKSATEAQLEKMAADVAEYRAMLDADLGKSGSDDFRSVFNQFVKAVYHRQKGLPMPAHLEKAAADYVTSTDATGGYLVPTLVGDQVQQMTLRSGQLWPHLNKVTIPAGVAVKMPYESTLASVAWRVSQGGAGTEIDPNVAWGADTLRPSWINGYAKVANEAMTAPGISIPDNIAMQLMGQIVRKIEYGVLLGDDSASAYPHDGLLVASSVNSQTALATPTLANVANFIGECIADHEGSGDTSENFLVTTDAVAHVLKSAASATGANAWGDPVSGVPAQLFGYRLITSPHAISTTNRLLMSPLGKITVGWTGQFSVSFNESLGWASNETWMMVSTHADFGIGNPDLHHKAVVTALS